MPAHLWTKKKKKEKCINLKGHNTKNGLECSTKEIKAFLNTLNKNKCYSSTCLQSKLIARARQKNVAARATFTAHRAKTRLNI